VTLKLSLTFLMVAIVGACGAPDGPPLEVSGVAVLEPLPGTDVTAGYLRLDNNTDQSIEIAKVASPQFRRVDIHETVIQDDIARMVPVAPLVIDPRSHVLFEPAGKHLMMSGWSSEPIAGAPVTIEVHYNTNGLLIVATTVSSRDAVTE